MIPQQALSITPIPAFEDNYLWLIHNDTHAAVIDPGDADAVIHALQVRNLSLTHILITHHHADHIGGVKALQRIYSDVNVYAPINTRYDFTHQTVVAGDHLLLDALKLKLVVLGLAGHTLDHVGYYSQGMVFCGDTLFGAGCGRLFEGSPAQMYDSLQTLAKLPPNTQVFCAHEYTAHNIAFALTVDKDNPALINRQSETTRLRAMHVPTVPSSIALELATNPFLRCLSASIQTNLGYEKAETSIERAVAVFSKLREMRNHF